MILNLCQFEKMGIVTRGLQQIMPQAIEPDGDKRFRQMATDGTSTMMPIVGLAWKWV